MNLATNDGLVSHLRIDIRGAVGEIRLDRPHVRNAVDLALAHELDRAFTAVEEHESTRVILLTANGPAFCAGQDLKALAAGEPEAFIDGLGWAGVTHRPRTKPLVAVVQGPALAGGFELVLAADLVVASTDACFGLPEVHHGLLAAAGGAARLPLRIPATLASEMLLTGDPITAQRAYELGLVNIVAPAAELMNRAEQLADRIAQQPVRASQAALAVAQLALDEGEAAADLLAWDLLTELRDLQ